MKRRWGRVVAEACLRTGTKCGGESHACMTSLGSPPPLSSSIHCHSYPLEVEECVRSKPVVLFF